MEIDFLAKQGEDADIDLPCVNKFPIQDSHVNLDIAIEGSACVPISDGAYRLRDGSVLFVWFEGPGDGQLQEARWYRPVSNENLTLPTAQVTATVYECAHDANDSPTLRIADVDRLFASVPVTPQWSFQEPVWQTTVALPVGHYIIDSRTKHCTGESEQLVAIAGQTRHVTVTLDYQATPTKFIARVDENMYASAVYGVLPSLPSRVEIMAADSIIGEQTRRPATIDGNFYEFDHLRSGRYVVRVVFGDVVASREVVIPKDVYGATVRADLTTGEASEIVRTQAAGTGYFTVKNYMHEKVETHRLGPATVDRWTNELTAPSDYNIRTQRIGTPVLHALEVAQHFLSSDERVPPGFRTLSAFSIGIGGSNSEIFVNLVPVDLNAWRRNGPKRPESCYVPEWDGNLTVVVNEKAWRVDEVVVCP
ncbi:MAG TPA: hypothetical protein VMT95_15710 [Candidatus Binatia bacterium]|nr:hypothetical protein [Candidatus Binatia bacterium]